MLRIGWIIIVGLFTSITTFAAKPNPAHYANWLGPETCAECHEVEATIWRHAHHATSFKKMPRSQAGKNIAKSLGIKRIKMAKACGSCHISYTLKKGSKRLKAVAGVSCESCHGPAKNWNTVHQDYGGKHVTAKQETASHKANRWAQSEKSGMIRPSNHYKLFKQCYQCHTIPDETLINKTTHPKGDEFELVKWSNGEVRHNVWRSVDQKNKIRPIHQQRIRYIMGQALMLEFALRGLSQATLNGKYAETMTMRAKNSINTLKEINTVLSISEISNILSVIENTTLNHEQKDQLIGAADKISELNQQFVNNHDGKAFGAIDSLLPRKYKGKPKR